MRLDEATILVVDDELYLRECYARWLQRSGCKRVLTAGNGIEALELIEAERFDALVTDIHMPLMDGIELIKAIWKRGATVPSVILVSACMDVDNAEMFNLGVESMLAKPFQGDELLREVERSLADRSDLWHTPMEDSPRQEVRIEGARPGPLVAADRICFGRGGFCVALPGLVTEGPVSFVIQMEPDLREMWGQGLVRWYSAQSRIGEVQLEYLAPGSRELLFELMPKQRCGNPMSRAG